MANNELEGIRQGVATRRTKARRPGPDHRDHRQGASRARDGAVIIATIAGLAMVPWSEEFWREDMFR